MKKVELIIEAIYINKLLDIFRNHDIGGYTIITDVEGSGAHGLRMADDVSEVSSNDYVFTICEEEKFLEMKDEMVKFRNRFGGKFFVTDTMVLD